MDQILLLSKTLRIVRPKWEKASQRVGFQIYRVFSFSHSLRKAGKLPLSPKSTSFEVKCDQIAITMWGVSDNIPTHRREFHCH